MANNLFKEDKKVVKQVPHNKYKIPSYKVRCPPYELKEVKGSNESIGSEDTNVILYDEGTFIKNDGFYNELIYKPNAIQKINKNSEINTQLVERVERVERAEPSIEERIENERVKRFICEKKEDKKDLPIANINVSYLLDKNNSTTISAQMKK